MGCFCLEQECDSGGLIGIREEEVVLAAPDVCVECRESIPAGTKVRAVWFVEPEVWRRVGLGGDFSAEKQERWVTCPACQTLADHFLCDAPRAYGGLLPDLEAEFSWGDIDLCCLDGLTPEAAAKLDRLMNEEKER